MKTVLGRFLEQTKKERISLDTIRKALSLPEADGEKLRAVVRELVREGRLRNTDRRGVYLKSEPPVEGVVERRKGRLRIRTADGKVLPAVRGRKAGPFFPGDTVRAVPGRRGEAVVREVVRPGSLEIPGFVYGSDFIPETDFGDVRFLADPPGAYGRQAVLVLDPESRKKDTAGSVTGRVRAVRGEGNFPSFEAMQVIRKEGLPLALPGKRRHTLEESAARRDLTDWKVFTIDGDHSRDFDDAVSVEKTESGWRLGVHIADVSAYVPFGSPVDKEAWRRGTSVYAGGGVVPMLPWELCDDLCSLIEGSPRPALSCVMEIDREGRVTDYGIFESLVTSKRRMRYSEVNRLFAGEKVPSLEGFEEELDQLRELCGVLLEKRRRPRGAVLFEMPEEEIIFGDDHMPVRAEKYYRGPAECLIEEMMLVANETVASFAAENEIDILYRVHDAPDSESVAALRAFLRPRGIRLEGGAGGKDYQKLIAQADAREDAEFIKRRMLRSFTAACYSGEQGFHFGLGSPCYCHFTSPIRRYPDLHTHRAIKAFLRGEDAPSREAQAGWLSEAERNAVHAERSVSDVMKAWIMLPKKGRRFDGRVVSVHSFGAFVEVDGTAEGLIPVRLLKGGWLDYDEDREMLRNPKRTVRPGDWLKVRLTEVDTTEGKLTFAEE